MSKVDLSVRVYDSDIAIPDFESNLRKWIVNQGYKIVLDRREGIGLLTGEKYVEMTFTLHADDEERNGTF